MTTSRLAWLLSLDESGDSLRQDHEYNWRLTWQSGDIILQG